MMNLDIFNKLLIHRGKLLGMKRDILEAFKKGEMDKVLKLQWKLVRSLDARIVITHKIYSNKGSGTPGIDGKILKTKKEILELVEGLKLKEGKYVAQPVKRVFIPKGNGKLRPLGIPSIFDRAYQALWTESLIDIADYKADSRSFGYRAKRSGLDAIRSLEHNLFHPTKGGR
jgi:RNA-directed DNA polymerase